MEEKWRVLVVDDDKDVLKLVVECLNDKYNVIAVNRSTQAQQVIERMQPDLVILDIMMPKVNGYQLAQYIKNHRDHKHIPVIFLSAKHTQSDMKVGYQKGADFYLTKPFQPDRLARNVDLIFERTPPSKSRKKFTFNEIKLRMEFFDDDENESHARLSHSDKEDLPQSKKRWY